MQSEILCRRSLQFMKRKQPRPVAPVAVDPNAPALSPGEFVEVLRRPLWTGYRGLVLKVDGGMCRCMIGPVGTPTAFHADIPAAELRKI